MQYEQGLEEDSMRAEMMFKEYKNMKRELSVLEFQLRRFEGVNEEEILEAMCFSHPVGEERIQTSSISDKTAKIALNYKDAAERENDDWYDFLLKRYKSLHEEITFFEHSVLELEGVLSEVIMDLLQRELTWESMMKKYNVSHAMIGKYRKAAIKELDARYELRDKQTEAYILS